MCLDTSEIAITRASIMLCRKSEVIVTQGVVFVMPHVSHQVVMSEWSELEPLCVMIFDW